MKATLIVSAVLALITPMGGPIQLIASALALVALGVLAARKAK